ncbi:MAG: hypothetical protein ACK6AD_03400 [Cyanobacteriota bacterium]|jgi:hypothetical protein
MATASSPNTRSRRQQDRPADAMPRWGRWLLLGLFFGLGHGLTQRLLEVRWGEDSTRPPAFRAKAPADGLSLEELRRRHPDQAKPLTADLDLLARQKREARQKQELAKREEAARQKAALQEEHDRVDSDRTRLEEFNRTPEPATSEAIQQDNGLPSTPPAPELPPPESPEPSAAEPPPALPSQTAAPATPSQP